MSNWGPARGPALVCVLAGACVAAAAQEDFSKWTHVAELSLETAPARGVVEFPLAAEVFARARADLADLRLVDPKGRPAAYVLRVDTGRAERTESRRPARLYNRTFRPGKESCVTADFGRPELRTRIDVVTAGVNFRRRVKVEAGEDGRTWRVLRKSAWLFRVHAGAATFELNRVDLPENDFRYLRVTVFHAPDDPEKVEIREVRSLRVTVKARPPQTAAVVPLSQPTVTQIPKDKATDITADLGQANLPLCKLALAFEDRNFLRAVEIFGRNREKRIVMERFENAPPRRREVDQPWTSVQRGTVYRFSGGGDRVQADTDFALGGGAGYRYLRIRIHNGDNAPLKFTGLKVRRYQHYLAFQPKGPGAYRLYVGNAEARKPRYDLVHFIGRLRKEGVAAARLGALGANPALAVEEKAVPWSERHKGLLWAALAVVIVVLGVLVVRRLRQAPPAEDS